MKKSDLLKHIEDKGIILDIDRKYTNKDLEFLLAEDYYKRNPQVQTWGMRKRLFNFQTPQLCFSFKELKPEEQKNVLTSEDWMAETKIDGFRCIVTYHPDFGFEFFSRDISEQTFLPNSYTDKILLIKNSIVKKPSSFKYMFNKSFILDGEVLVENKNLNTSNQGGGQSYTELNSTTAILGSNPERALEIQLEGNPLKFYIFDCLEVGDLDLTNQPLRTRKGYLKKLLDLIGDRVPFELPESHIENKQEFFDKVISQGGEGIVLKNLNETYYATTARKRHVQIKMKRSLSEVSNEDMDCFISGSILPKKNSALHVENLIGGIKVSVFLKEEDGSETEHWIGTISGITDSLRRRMTVLDEEGNPTLNPEYYGKVLAVNGQDISSKNLRMSHCRALDWNFRIDKSISDCIVERSFIESQIL